MEAVIVCRHRSENDAHLFEPFAVGCECTAGDTCPAAALSLFCKTPEDHAVLFEIRAERNIQQAALSACCYRRQSALPAHRRDTALADRQQPFDRLAYLTAGRYDPH